MPKTKIVCTIGPASNSPEILERLIQSGMDVARLNFSHGTQASHKEVTLRIRRLTSRSNRPIAILQDLSGPKIRNGPIERVEVSLKTRDMFTLTNRQVPGDNQEVSVSYQNLPEDVHPGDTLLLSDGALELEVVETSPQDIECRVVVVGLLSSFKGINLPTSSLRIPVLTEKDKKDLDFGISQEVDYVALSFVRTAADVEEAQRLIQDKNRAVRVGVPGTTNLVKAETLE